MGDMRNVYIILVEKPKVLVNGAGGGGVRRRLDASGSEKVPAGCCSGSIKGGEFD